MNMDVANSIWSWEAGAVRIVIDQLVKIDGEAHENEQRNSAALVKMKSKL